MFCGGVGPVKTSGNCNTVVYYPKFVVHMVVRVVYFYGNAGAFYIGNFGAGGVNFFVVGNNTYFNVAAVAGNYFFCQFFVGDGKNT